MENRRACAPPRPAVPRLLCVTKCSADYRDWTCGIVALQRCRCTWSGKPACTCRGVADLQMILLAQPARWPCKASGSLHTASAEPRRTQQLPDTLSNPAARSHHAPPATLARSQPLTNTPLTGAFTTPPVLDLGEQTTPPGGCHAQHTSSMAHSSIPAHLPRARASLQPVLCPSSTILGGL